MRIMLGNPETSLSQELEGSTFVFRGFDFEGDKRKKQCYDHCKKPWHTKETCWKFRDKRLNWKRKSSKDGRTFQAITEESQEHQINLEIVSFMKEQLEHLYKCFQSLKLFITHLVLSLKNVIFSLLPFLVSSRI